MLELFGELAVENPGDDVLDQLLVGLRIEADHVLVVGGKLIGAIFRGAVNRDLSIGVDSFSVEHSLFIAQVQVAVSLNLGRWLIIFDPRVLRVTDNCFSSWHFLLW